MSYEDPPVEQVQRTRHLVAINTAAPSATVSTGANIIFRPTHSQRNVLLVIQATQIVAPYMGTHHTETFKISRIFGLFVNSDNITEAVFDQPDEAALLRSFWRAINANDRIFGSNIMSAFTLVRRRSWQLDIILSPNIALQQVYAHEFWDFAVHVEQ